MSFNPNTIAYERSGQGPAALLIHGNPATHTLWRPVTERLIDIRTMFAIDLPGFGRSTAAVDRGGNSLERLAHSIVDFADAHDLGQFDLVGHSFGGGIALTMCAMVPERIRTLTAITPLTDRMPPLGVLARVPPVGAVASLLWRGAPQVTRRWIARTWAHLSYGDGFTSARGAEIAFESDRPNHLRPMVDLMRGVDALRYRDRLRTVAGLNTTPILFIGATDDRIIPHTRFLDLTRRFPNARVVSLEGSGHVPMWQFPHRVSDLIRGFWLDTTASRPPLPM